ncbi:hypothetical protein BHU72_02515 [Desulfuribacillus stibiiarsenatis]|uniref:Peptidase M20 dimerisation domain-containing protein n=1 Tax=Desulfuribacillus stibiiarsenatis TaxID=1390249 RepID=A0A1E5L6A2_9FIRM|nr:M20/M25/M40 family metallo-hydrolase [Desulfuribacillus stibiiarsenatis]OEH85687.1 hypothetical protein BHU72_02515 [Desulfuribacillus stibiiarsenatis]
MINEKRLLEQFLALVKIDSETRNERLIVNELLEIIQNMGYNAVEDDSATKAQVGAGNIIVTIPGTKKAKSIMFTAHVDTVVPGKNIQPVVKDGYVYSCGKTILGSDDKAGVAAILEMAHVIREQQMEHGNILIILTVGEECGLLGSKNINRDLLKADMGVALDSNGNVGRIVIQGPVQKTLQATITGKAAHAGVNPEDGISAIEIAAEAIYHMPLGRIDKESTANIGIIEGGKATNIVCESITLKGEARSLNREKLARQISAMEAELHKATEKRGATIALDIIEEYPEFSFTEQDEEIKIVKKAMENIGVIPELVGSGGGSDANIFNGYGIRTLNLGIGMENIHSVNERIEIEQIYQASRLLVEIVKVVADHDR